LEVAILHSTYAVQKIFYFVEVSQCAGVRLDVACQPTPIIHVSSE
jgi:hypothetical protein